MQLYLCLQPPLIENTRQSTIYTYHDPSKGEVQSNSEAEPVTVQVHIPKLHWFDLPRVELHKPGAFTQQELDRFAAVLRAANQFPQEDAPNVQVCSAHLCCQTGRLII